ncbi:hypothetical protein UlMin_000290, partial [Ulmus minor]
MLGGSTPPTKKIHPRLFFRNISNKNTEIPKSPNHIFSLSLITLSPKSLSLDLAPAPNGCCWKLEGCCCLCPLLRKAFRKIHMRLVREFEKVQWEGHQRRALLQRPCTCTLTAIHDAILEDVVHPAEIVGKCVRYRIDGSKIIKFAVAGSAISAQGL